MKILFISTVILGQFFGGYALAAQTEAETVMSQCQQEATAAGAEDIMDYVYLCLEKKLEHEKDD